MSQPPFTDLRRERRTALARATVYVLATESVAHGHLLHAVEAALRGGAGVVQVREKGLPDDLLVDRARALLDLCQRYGALCVVNDRIDVAETIGADGVHVGQEDAGVAEARRRLGPDALVGVSTHDASELERALTDEADYVGVGSLYPTATKGRFVPVGSPETLAPLAARAEAVGVPAFGIGGIDTARIAEVAAAGFRRVAVSAGVLAAPDPEAAAATMLRALTPRV